ncbi:MAG: tRNA pseudouridine(55) synthase TruB [Bacteroidetes bacterium]|nr:tRNA pseudouridine(55) synthase TruB [Bacteroidota bacterium]
MNQEPEEERIILVNKPYGWSSFQAVKKIKYLFKARKCGHAGTLDPLATGLLILCTGKATRKLEGFQGQEKEYTGTMVLGGTTPSYDMETEVMEHFPIEHINPELITKTLPMFTGFISQVPPLFSAVKVDGKRAYKLARQGVAHQLEARTVEVREFEITRIALPELDFRVVCSKGTYIRSLIHDFGKALNSGAYLKTLCRTRIGDFSLAEAKTPAEWQELLHKSTETN